MKAKQTFILFFLICISWSCFAQTTDSSKTFRHFSSTASLTNNGISLVPSFSLGKPATLLLMSVGGNRFSIDPDIRFGLNGKPWTFLFWARYKLVKEGNFRLHTGAHLGLNYRPINLLINGAPTENFIVRRYLAAELAPSYFIAKNISFGSYYLYSRGIDNGTVKNTHFITLNANFSRLPISQNYYLRLSTQVFYLNQDDKKGYYVTTLLALAKNNFPLSVSYLINNKLKSDIPGKNFISSLSLHFSFNQYYVPKQPVL